MNDQPTLSKTEQRTRDAQYYRSVLHGLIDVGVDLARLVHEDAKAQTGAAEADDSSRDVQAPKAAEDFTVAFERIARTVRRTIALARAVAEPVAPERAASPSGSQRLAARKQIIREVEDTIQRRVGGDEAERLRAELGERLDAPDLDDDISDLPIDAIIANICRDLGIAHLPGSHPWQRRTPADVAALVARAAGVGAVSVAAAKAGSARSGDAPSPAELPPSGGSAPARGTLLHGPPQSGCT